MVKDGLEQKNHANQRDGAWATNLWRLVQPRGRQPRRSLGDRRAFNKLAARCNDNRDQEMVMRLLFTPFGEWIPAYQLKCRLDGEATHFMLQAKSNFFLLIGWLSGLRVRPAHRSGANAFEPLFPPFAGDAVASCMAEWRLAQSCDVHDPAYAAITTRGLQLIFPQRAVRADVPFFLNTAIPDHGFTPQGISDVFTAVMLFVDPGRPA